jgi:hypothetical protein
MHRTHLFFKVEIEHDERESPEQLAGKICRQLLKVYGVRTAELASFTPVEE